MATTVSDVEEQIKQLKLEGNSSFSKKDYGTAIKYYTEGLEKDIYESKIQNDRNSLIELRQSLLLNRAKCHFKLKNLRDALIDSSECINTSNDTKLYFKAHYTRSEIYLHLNDYKNAMKHCDEILNASSTLNITTLQERTKKLSRQIKEKSMSQSTQKMKQHRSRRPNNILNAMTLTMEQHRQRIQSLQKSKPSDDIALVISCKWWRKWCSLDGTKKLNELDMSILMVDNVDLISTEDASDNIIDICSPYLKYNVRHNIEYGVNNDYILLSFKTYQEMVQMGYKMQPTIWVKKCGKKYELFKSIFTVHFAEHRVSLSCSLNCTIRKLCTEIARHFVIQSSSIRLRYSNVVLDRSHSLYQHLIVCGSILFVEIRLPSGCWPIINDRREYNICDSDINICSSCTRIISHYISCGTNGCNAKYCNNVHYKSHWKYHEGHHNEMPRNGMCGLRNLGNTCYLNSSFQCLSFIPELRCYLISDDYIDDINRDNPLGFGGKLASSFGVFLKKMWFGFDSIIDPSSIRSTIGLLHSSFQSDSQQDAEEFIRWLLDGLHEDLNLIHTKPYYALPDSNNRNDSCVANEHWTLHLKRNQSIIVDIFQGQYKSTLQCPNCECMNKSVKFDAFSALSVPIPDVDTQIAVECLVFTNNDDKPYRLTVNVSGKAVVAQLTANLQDKLKDISPLLVCRVNHNKFGKYWSCGRPITAVFNPSQITYIYQVNTTTIAQRKEKGLIQCRMNFCYKPSLHSQSDSSDSDDYYNNFSNKNIYFAHPKVFDVKHEELNGNTIHKMFKIWFKSVCISNKYPQNIEMLINQDIIAINDDILQLTNAKRNVATISVCFTEYEYKLHINPHLAVAYSSFDSLSDVSPNNCIDIYDCLKLYTAAEVLDDVVWKCCKCNKEAKPTKQLHLWRLPQILIIHLKRFINQLGYFGGIGKKNSKKVDVPIDGLDLNEYIAQNNQERAPKYDLIATLNHHGIMEFGHYYSAVRTDFTTQITNYLTYYHDNTDKAIWNMFNDEKVHQISKEQLKQYSKDAYLLFYRRRDNV